MSYFVSYFFYKQNNVVNKNIIVPLQYQNKTNLLTLKKEAIMNEKVINLVYGVIFVSIPIVCTAISILIFS